MDRNERQKLCLKRWLNSSGKASIEACTGFGFKFFCICFGKLNNIYYICIENKI